jgi:pyrroloquinoline quinone (PQQ) biosynthesis protein C
MKRSEWVTQLGLLIAERNLLKHPFYQDWQAGMPTRERLLLYAAQYYLHAACTDRSDYWQSPTAGHARTQLRTRPRLLCTERGGLAESPHL